MIITINDLETIAQLAGWFCVLIMAVGAIIINNMGGKNK